jgi:hypothetical protein
MVTLSALYEGVTRTATFTVNPAPPPPPPPLPALASLSLNPTSIVGGNSVTGTVTLSAAAPSGGSVVTLGSSNASIATVPPSVTVAPGSTSNTFIVTTKATKRNTSVTISASYNGVTRTATIAVKRK